MQEFGPVNPDATKEPLRRASFFGTAYHKVSDRNQVAIPKHFCKTLEDAQEGPLLLMRANSEGFLRLYTQKQLDAKFEAIRQRSDLDDKTKTGLIRMLARTIVNIEPDKQGRFVLPAHWVAELNLQSEVAFCGAFNWIEIWPAAVRRDQERLEQEVDADTAALMENILNG